MTLNTAVWLTAAAARPFEVKGAPLWTPSENEILIRNHAIAINPVDGNLQAATNPWWRLEFPTILGQDIAGVVAAVGPNVTRFKVGDRVLGHGVGVFSREIQGCAFQAHTIVRTNMACGIPDSISFESAAVIPLGFSTASCGLFEKDMLNLQLPTVPPQNPTGKTLLIWGGASSVGSNAIQLAVAAGYEVITTASPKNFGYVRELGASQVFDYSSSSVVADLVNSLDQKTLAGALDCIGEPAWQYCMDVLHKSTGNKFIATTKRGFPCPPEGVSIKQMFGISLKDNDLGRAVYEQFLPKALIAGIFVPSPTPLIAGRGLESVQEAVDICRKGTSAKKVVVSLP